MVQANTVVDRGKTKILLLSKPITACHIAHICFKEFSVNKAMVFTSDLRSSDVVKPDYLFSIIKPELSFRKTNFHRLRPIASRNMHYYGV